MLEALDELGLSPSCISGTGIGAIVGALYGSGISARELREDLTAASFTADGSVIDDIFNTNLRRWWDLLDLNFSGQWLLDIKEFLAHLQERIGVNRFEELKTPLRIVAADFWKREQVVFDKGPLIPAVHASMALPGIFQPAHIDGRVLVDSGAVNPVPFDVLPSDCDVVVAIDVLGRRTPEEEALFPSFSESLFNTVQIMEKSIVRDKLNHRAPTICIEPEITGTKVLEFYNAAEVFRQAQPAKDRLKFELLKLLD